MSTYGPRFPETGGLPGVGTRSAKTKKDPVNGAAGHPSCA